MLCLASVVTGELGAICFGGALAKYLDSEDDKVALVLGGLGAVLTVAANVAHSFAHDD
jgi:hypothetical protein